MTIDMVLWNIYDKIYSKLGNAVDADRVFAPLNWYVQTGRAPAQFELILKNCKSRQITTIANRLIKYNGFDYDSAINSVCQYIGFDRFC